jgi:hypothetical protein
LKKEKKKVTWHGHNFHNAKTKGKKFLVGEGAGVLQLICCMGELVRKIEANAFRYT